MITLPKKETITFASAKTKSFAPKTPLPGYEDAVLKYCMAANLPTSAPKNNAFYTLDTHELFHGNGPELLLSKITNDNSVTKDIVIVMYNITIGRVEPEVIFPYVGRLKSVQLVPDSNITKTQRIIIDLETYKNGTWNQLCRLFMNANDETVIENLNDVVIDNQLLRLNVIDIQDDINYLVAHVKIDLV